MIATNWFMEENKRPRKYTPVYLDNFNLFISIRYNCIRYTYNKMKHAVVKSYDVMYICASYEIQDITL